MIPIVFAHGFLGSPKDWDVMCKQMAPRPCYCVKLPGHGADVFQISIQEPIFDLVGYSMGGRLSLQYVQKHPERIRHLLAISTHPGLQTEEEKQKRWESDLKWAELLQSLPIDEFLHRWYDQPVFSGCIPDFSMRKLHDPQSLSQSLLSYSLARQPFIDCQKALHIVGEKDHKFRKLHPQAKIIQNAGHMVHLENPIDLSIFLKEVLI